MSLFGRSAESKRPETPSSQSNSPLRNDEAISHPGLGRPPNACVIGAKTTVKGDVLGDEDVHIDGTVEGLVRVSRDVRVGASGTVRATIEAAAIVISGEVVGDCRAANRVELQSTGRLTGNIRAPRIVIAEGAVFRGSSDMSSASA